MALVKSNKIADAVKYRCKLPCRNYYSLKKYIYKKIKQPLRTSLRFVYYLAYKNCSDKDIKRELKIVVKPFWMDKLSKRDIFFEIY